MSETSGEGSNTWTAALSVPSLLARLASDEYRAPVYRPRDLQALELLAQTAGCNARRLGRSLGHYFGSRLGTVACLNAINAVAGQSFYRVSGSAGIDGEEAEEILRGTSPVIDVQTHFVAGHRAGLAGARGIHHFIRQVAPEWFSGLDLKTDLSIGEFLRCVFLESETSLAVLTSAPGTEETNILSNAEIAGTRELVDRLAGSGRLLHHAIVHPNLPGELDSMARIVERFRPDGFKVYTLYNGVSGNSSGGAGWMLDDEDAGLPFLQRACDLGVHIICAHKGLSMLAPSGSPRDIGPAALAFPGLKFLVYHSGYEVPSTKTGEGPFIPGAQQQGVDRLVQSLRDAGIPPGANVYAELGSTWYILIRRPEEAAHVLGKLLLAVGEDNILWGTDSVWYGSAQPLIDAFRAFQIPQEYQERHGYPALTDEIKNKILGLNAARVYDVDARAVYQRGCNDDLAWIRQAVLEFNQRNG
ncbi:MAG: amidohydrolase family protein [Halioglobus sp.]|nr:amidohydrolase family protein [Halioglobus sp.]